MTQQKHTSLFFIQEHKGRTPMHGGVGNTDIEQIFLAKGFHPILFPYQESFSFKAKIFRLTHLLGLLLKIPSNAIVIFQFPLYARMNKFFLKWSYLRKVTVICLIADIDGLKSGNQELLNIEKKQLSVFRYFIVHNNAMQQWLEHFITNIKTSQLEFFDFLATPFAGERKKSFEIAFAGNLSKSLFLEKLDHLMNNNRQVILNVYGEGITDNMQCQKMIGYKAVVEPALLPATIEGSFGLVWDGDGSFDRNDNLAHYMPFISHHKLSLYILSGLPIIVYAKAGSAALVEKYGIGITIDNLAEIQIKLDLISEEAYQQMRKNMQPLAQKIMSGGCLSEALDKMLNEIK